MKKESLSALKKKLDSVFSLFIRYRDRGRCYTCGMVKEPSEMQAGHYISRTCLALRFDEMNVHCQCYGCNCMKHGDIITYREHLVKDYGLESVERLESRRHESVKLTSAWYHDMIDHYRQRLKVYQTF
jgi:hypothetical protein